jgi:ATP-dependent Clp protease protease subunit
MIRPNVARLMADRPLPLVLNGAVLNKIELPEGLAQQQRKPFFARSSGRRFEAKTAEDTTTITLYDEIGFFGVTAKMFNRMLAEVKTPKGVLKINSPGGDVFDGIAMHNDLAAHPADWTVQVTGLAASAASIVAMAGDRIEIAENAFLMIHNAWTITLGDKHELGEVADLLAQIDGALADTYVARTGKKRDEIEKMMDAETWLGGKEAVAQGFADATFGAGKEEAKAFFDLSAFKNAPRELLRSGGADDWQPPETRRDVERLLMQDAGLTRSQARAAMAVFAKGPPNATQDAGPEAAIAALKRLNATLTP